MPALLGVDYGSVRIGLAISPEGDSPRPLPALLDQKNPFLEIKKLAADNDVETIVLGLPRNLDGEDTPQTAAAREFGEKLQKTVPAKVVFQDEAGSSSLAKERLRSRGVNADRAKGLVDSEAAVIILEDYLNA